MLQYLEKFKSIPKEVRSKISSSKVTQIVTNLERKYGVKLATLVIRVIIFDVSLGDLKNILIKELKLADDKAGILERELREKVLIVVWDYLEPTSSRIEIKSLPKIKKEKLLPITEKKLLTDGDRDKSVIPEKHKIQIKKEVKNITKDKSVIKEELPAEGPIARLPKEIGLNHLLPKAKNRPVVSDFSKPKPRPVIEKKIETVVKKDDIIFDNDEKEIKKIKKEMPKQKDGIRKETDGKIESIMKEVKIDFSSEELLERFKQIIATYLLGVRNRIATKEIMMRGVDGGGLGLNDEKSSKIMMVVAAKKEGANNVLKNNVNIRATDNGASFIFNKHKEEEKVEKNKTVSQEINYDLASALKEKRMKPIIEKVVNEEKVENVKIEKNNINKTNNDKPSLRAKSVPVGKKSMDDIKTPKVMSPMDELAYMDLVAFRRLDSVLEKRIKKIKRKIDLFSKEGIDKMINGIRAWRQSPVNKTYLKIGEESMNEGMSIEDVIKVRKEKGLNYLDKDEFDIVMDLNKQLRF